MDTSLPELQQLVRDVADLRRLLLQDILVGQTNTKTADDMWKSFNEARQIGVESVLKCQQQEAEITRLKSEIASCRAALRDAASCRHSLERGSVERENEMMRLKSRLSACEDANRDLLVCTTRLSESIFDLAGATDVEDETQRVHVRYDQLEIRCAHLQRLISRANEERSALEQLAKQWADSYHQLHAQSSALIAERDRTIEILQARDGEK